MRKELTDGWITFNDHFLSKTESEDLFGHLLKNVPWEQGVISLFGKRIPIPRMEAFYAEGELSYGYSGQRLRTHSFTPILSALKKRIEGESGYHFNSVLLNLYKDGSNSNGWHADNEKELGIQPTIASLSLGATRRFDLKHNHLKEKLSFNLNSGSLLIMGGNIQHCWKHRIPKQSLIVEPRINLTFRTIIESV